jgi:hypothetical protein
LLRYECDALIKEMDELRAQMVHYKLRIAQLEFEKEQRLLESREVAREKAALNIDPRAPPAGKQRPVEHRAAH